MDLNQYLSSKENSAAALARAIGVSQAIVYQWRVGLRPVPVSHCAAIEKATDGAVTRKDLRPKDWHLIWPELATPSPRLSPSAHEESARGEASDGAMTQEAA